MPFIDLKIFLGYASPSSMTEGQRMIRENDLPPVDGLCPTYEFEMRRAIQRQSQSDQLFLLGPVPLHGIRPAYLSRKPGDIQVSCGQPSAEIYHLGIGGRSPAIPSRMPIRPGTGGFMPTSLKSSLQKPENFTPPIHSASSWIKRFMLGFDSIDLCLALFHWAEFRKRKGAENSIPFWIHGNIPSW